MMIKSIFIFIFVLFYFPISQENNSNKTLENKFLGYDKISFPIKYIQTSCVHHMNKFYELKNKWECSVLYTEKTPIINHQKNQTLAINHQKFKDKFHSECLCSYKYECYDHEEFQLESELVDINEYMKKENFKMNNIYTEQCKSGLEQLTDLNDWNCVLKYDRFHIDEYYCGCMRTKICRIEKILKL